MTDLSYEPRKRLAYLDAFRGMVIAVMLIVNNPGSWRHVYPALRHATWHGCTPADLVFPCFLFISGAGLWYMIEHARGRDSFRFRLYSRIFRRCCILLVCGLGLNALSVVLETGFANPHIILSTIRLPGVLQRISLAYLVAAIVATEFSSRVQWSLALGILVGYWLALIGVPVPQHGPGVLTPDGSLPAFIDRLLLTPAHLYRNGTYDPEGLAASLPAGVSVLAGFFTARWISSRPVTTGTSMQLLAAAAACISAGGAWGLVFPINKPLWTSSYVVFSTGWALLFYAAWYEIVEVRGHARWGKLLYAFGRNALPLYVASGILSRMLYAPHITSGNGRSAALPLLHTALQQHTPLGPVTASLAVSVFYCLFWWVLFLGLFRKGRFIRAA